MLSSENAIDAEFLALAHQVANDPQNARAQFELGRYALRTRDWQRAVDCFQNVTQLAPQVEAGHFNLGNALFQLSRYDEAIAAYQFAFALEPSAESLNNLANTFAASGRNQNAIDTFRQALGLTKHVALTVQIYGNLGKAYSQTGRWNEAMNCFKLALLADPTSQSARNNYLRSCLRINDLESAVEALNSSTLSNPLDQEAHMLAAQIYRRLNRFGNAMTSLLAVLETNSDDESVISEIAALNFQRGRRTEALICYQRARTFVANSPPLHSQWLKQCNHRFEVTSGELLREATGWVSRHVRQTGDNEKNGSDQVASRTPGDFQLHSGKGEHDRIVLGLLVNEDEHPGSCQWLLPLIRHIDRTRISLVVFADGLSGPATTRQDAHDSVTWVESAHLSDAELETHIRSRDVEVFIDMVGHGLCNRLAVLAQQPAKVQLNWLGSLVTSGLPQVKYVLTDSCVCPQDLLPHMTETAVRLPRTCVCYEFTCNEVKQPSRTAFHDSVVFGSAASPEKLSEQVIDTWSRILSKVTSSTLVLFHDAFGDKSVQQDYCTWFENHGIESNRLDFASAMHGCSWREVYRTVDISLDPFPVNDPLSAMQSMMMGVPVICWNGNRMAGRIVASLVSSVNLPRCVASTLDEYVEQAVNLACDAQLLVRLRNELPATLMSSDVCNAAKFVNAFQDAIGNILFQSSSPGSR